MSLFVLFCVGLISLIILGVTYVLGSTMDDNCVGAWLFTSIGFKKPVVTSDDMNPEVFELFHIGETFASGNLTELKRVLEDFVNGFDANVEIYRDALDKASEEFSPEMFARRVEAIIKA